MSSFVQNFKLKFMNRITKCVVNIKSSNLKYLGNTSIDVLYLDKTQDSWSGHKKTYHIPYKFKQKENKLLIRRKWTIYNFGGEDNIHLTPKNLKREISICHLNEGN